MTDLPALRKRVEGLTRPDRDVDYAIRRAMTALTVAVEPRFLREGDDSPSTPYYTASIDAALALVERLLPGANWDLSFMDEGDPDHWYDASVGESYAEVRSTPAIAIILALLRALEPTNPNTEGKSNG